MPSLTLDRFDGGLDLRRGASVTDANRLRVLTNASVTAGREIRKRPCLNFVYQLEPGTVGLKASGGKLNTFYGTGAVSHANPLFAANKLVHPTVPTLKVSKAHYADTFLGFLYAAVEYEDGSVKHHYLDGASPTHIADANCPNTKGIIKAVNKIWATKSDVVRFCAAGNPRDWTTASDAGFIPVGRYQNGTSESLALGTLKKQLAVFFNDGVQLWKVDEDPDLNALTENVAGVGTQFPRSPASFASDVFFLSDIGFRSITAITLTTDNFQDVDVGSPIDTLVAPSLVTPAGEPEAFYVPAFGQYWCFVGKTAWVYTFSRTAKIACWSQYVFNVSIDAAAALNNKLYVRSGDNVYELTNTVFTDDGVSVRVEIQMPYLDAKEPGNLKQWWGADWVGEGTASLAWKYEQNNAGLITQEYGYTGDTSPGTMHPVEVCSTNISPVIIHESDEDFKMSALRLYYHSLGPI
jgi:hypothetical protein